MEVTLTVVITSITVIATAGWAMTVPAITIMMIGWTLGRIYIAAQLPVKRLKSNAKAPIVSLIQATSAGLGMLVKLVLEAALNRKVLASVRAYGSQESATTELHTRVNAYGKISYPFYDLNRWEDQRATINDAAYPPLLKVVGRSHGYGCRSIRRRARCLARVRKRGSSVNSWLHALFVIKFQRLATVVDTGVERSRSTGE
jgi:hypothetical protein